MKVLALPVLAVLLALGSPCWAQGQECDSKFYVLPMKFKVTKINAEKQRMTGEIDDKYYEEDIVKSIANIFSSFSSDVQYVEREMKGLVLKDFSDNYEIRKWVNDYNKQKPSICPANLALVGNCTRKDNQVTINARLVDTRFSASNYNVNYTHTFRVGDLVEMNEMAREIACQLAETMKQKIAYSCGCSHSVVENLDKRTEKEMRYYGKQIDKMIKSLDKPFSRKSIKLLREVKFSQLEAVAPVLYNVALGKYKLLDDGFSNPKDAKKYFLAAKTAYCNSYSTLEAEIIRDLFEVQIIDRDRFYKWLDRQTSP